MRRGCALVLAGCAITSKAPPLELRYFTPEAVATPAPAQPPRESCARLRLGRIALDAHLQFRIAHRASPVQLELYDTLRWTARPDTYVRRSLSAALFGAGPLEQAVGGQAMTLDIDVIGFEEVVAEGHHAGRVQLGYQLHDDRDVVARGTVTFDRDAQGPQIARVVMAIGAALQASSMEIARRVVVQLCR